MHHHSQSNSFSMLFPMHGYQSSYYDEQQPDMYPYDSSVDCTLSLGTPSTRLSEERSSNNGSSCMPNTHCWDFFQNKNAYAPQPHKNHRNGHSSSSGNDPLVSRRCANCDTTSTPLWRNGPRGPKSLCNACGIRFKKEERRANAANANMNNNNAAMEQQHMMNNNSWYNYSQSQKVPCFSSAIGNEYSFMDDNSRESESGIPFFSWIADRPASLVHDYTR